MAKTLATQRTLRSLEKRGWLCAVVEKWLPPRGAMKFGVRKDVWQFGDVLACHPANKQIALIQTFPLARWNDHVLKIQGLPAAQFWKQSGGLVLLHGWARKPKDGVRGAKKVWTLREEML